MPADDRLLRILVEIDGLHDAGFLAFAAADAFVGIKQDAAARPFSESAARACFQAGRIQAGDADHRDKPAGHAAAGAHLDRAFCQRVILPVDDRADIHTGEAANALVHFIGLEDSGHNGTPLVRHCAGESDTGSHYMIRGGLPQGRPPRFHGKDGGRAWFYRLYSSIRRR